MTEIAKNHNVSVIVPVYNVEEYLSDCIESLLIQGDIHLEIILVNDGSTDNSEKIAQEYANKYDFINLISIKNGGLGNARNVGVKNAHGKYIFFIDSDDVLPINTLFNMFQLAERNNSELTICDVERFNSKKTWHSSLHYKVFRKWKEVSHINENLDFIYDTISCNKLILKSFFESHNFAFPTGIMYEDIPVTIPMHVLCNKVSVYNEVGYRWRVRDGATKSITQNTSDMQNLIDRIQVLKKVDAFFVENNVDEKIVRAQQRKTLEVDLKIFIDTCNKKTEAHAIETIDLINEYISEAIPDDIFKDLTVINQQKYEYVRKRDIKSLIDTLDFQQNNYYSAPIHEMGDDLVVDLPDTLFSVSSRSVTQEIADYQPRVYIDRILTNRSSFSVFGHVYIRRVNISNPGDIQFKTWLVNATTGTKIELPTEGVKTTFLTDSFGKVLDKKTGAVSQYIYDYSGFKTEIDIDTLVEGQCKDGLYSILVEYSHKFYSGEILLSGIDNSIKGKCDHNTIIKNEKLMSLIFSKRGVLHLAFTNNPLLVEDYKLEDNKLMIRLNQDKGTLKLIDYTSDENTLICNQSQEDYWIDVCTMNKDVVYNAFVDTGDNNLQYVNDESLSGKVLVSTSGAIIGMCFRTGAMKFKTLNNIAFVYKCKSENAECNVDIKYHCATQNYETIRKISFVIYDQISKELIILAEAKFEETDNSLRCHFSLNFDEQLTKNFYEGQRECYLNIEYADGSSEIEAIHCIEPMSMKIELPSLKILFYRSIYGTMRLSVEQLWSKRESTAMKRQLLIHKKYPEYLTRNINDKRILFESMWGRNYSCNPQALYEYIDKNYPDYECIWALNDEHYPIPGNAIRVRRNSLQYYYYLATSKYLVNNVNFVNDYVKRPEQVEVQTMHGTPLKTLGLEAQNEFPTEKDKEAFIEKNKRWDMIIAQGKFVHDKVFDIYNVNPTILDVGYPRTDKLFNVSHSTITEIKEKLNLPLDKKIVFYAPTWRVKNRFDMHMDIEKMRQALGDEYILLIRLHHLCAKGYSIPEDKKFVFNMNRYKYVEDLYLITDILITDYSSVMFDFLLLNRPMIFFTYDLNEYASALRGLYVDFEKEAPGPLCYTTDEIIEAINDKARSQESIKRLRKFKEKYLTYENANSSQLVFNAMLELGRKKTPIKKKVSKFLRRAFKTIKKN